MTRLPSWVTVGVRAYDTGENRVGIVKLLGDDAGTIAAGQPIQHATRALLRPADAQAPLWWANAVDLRQAGR